MKKAYLLLLLVAVLLPAASAIDKWFQLLCRSHLVDSPSEMNGYDRIKDNTCVQTFPYNGTQEQHETFCRSTLPFDYTMQRTDEQVTCIWENPVVQCNRMKKDHLYIRQIFSKCYAIAECHQEEYRLARPTSADEIRWIARLYREQHEAVIIESGKAIQVMKDMGYSEGFIHKTQKKDSQNVAMILSPLPIFGIYPGNALYDIPNKEQPTAKLCMVPVLVDGGVRSVASIPTTPRNVPSNAEQHKERNQFGSGSVYNKFPLKFMGMTYGHAFVTRNDYQPVLTSDGLLDLNHFHSQCAKICHQCFAATYELFTGYRSSMPYGRFWVPGQRKDATAPCGGQFDMQKRRHFLVKNNPESKRPHIPTDNHWWGGSTDTKQLPTYKCADLERIAVQLIHTEKEFTYVDVPVFDRQPIVCVSGQTVAEPQGADECFKNSEMKNGACQCKKSFTDALTVRDLAGRARQLGFHKYGQICVQPQKCNDITTHTPVYEAILFLVDGSGSIGYDNYKYNVQPFVNKFKYILPRDSSLLFYQYGEVGHYSWWTALARWTDETYDQAMHKAINTYLSSRNTKTYTHMYNMITESEKLFKKGGRKLMIVVTDGITRDFHQNVATRRARNRMEIIYITVGDGLERFIRETEYLNPIQVYGTSSFGGLTDTRLVDSITKPMCEEWPKGHVERVVYGENYRG